MTNNLLVKGICVNSGNLTGKARVINNMNELESVNYGDILVLPNSHPIYASAVMKAGAVVCENGGRLSHICIVALEMGIPCITQAEDATKKITSGQNIYINAEEGEIYDNE